jgi:hypothetical protein
VVTGRPLPAQPRSGTIRSMGLDHDHAMSLFGADSTYEVLRDAVVAAALARDLPGLALESSGLDLDVPIPLILKVDAWARYQIGDHLLLAELWGEAYDRSYGARLRLLSKPGLEVFASPPTEPDPPPDRWARGVRQLADRLGRSLDPTALAEVLGAGWPGPLTEIWDALVTRY